MSLHGGLSAFSVAVFLVGLGSSELGSIADQPAPPPTEAQATTESLSASQRTLEVRYVAHSRGFDPAGQVAVLDVLGSKTGNDSADGSLREKLHATGLVRFRVDRVSRALLKLDTERYWSPPLQIEPGHEDLSLTAPVFDRAFLEGRIAVPHGRKTPETLTLRLHESSGSSRTDATNAIALDASLLSCPVDSDGGFSCAVPATKFDARVGVTGLAPAFLWDLQPKENRALDVGKITLRDGSSVIGLMTFSAAIAPKAMADIRVGLTPLAPRSDVDSSRLDRLRTKDFVGSLSESGHFQIVGVPPGGYRLFLEPADFVVADSPPIRVGDHRNDLLVELGEVIVEQRLDIAVQISPPLDAESNPWQVRLISKPVGGDRVYTDSRAATAGDDGAAVFDELSPGTYFLSIVDQDGSRWLDEEVTIGPLDSVLWRDLSLIAVEGHVEGAEDLWPLTLWFGGRHGASSVRFVTDDKGRFEGYLPRAGEWAIDWATGDTQLQVRSLDSISIATSSARKTRKITIEIPETRLAGRVMGQDREPVPEAIVIAIHVDRQRREAFEQTDDDGRFVLDHLTPGTITVQATAGVESSAWSTVQIAEDSLLPDIELVVAPKRIVRGLVSSATGPVAGALIRASMYRGPNDPSVSLRISATSGVDGQFDLEVPAVARNLRLAVLPIGFAARFLVMSVESDEPFFEIDASVNGGTLVLEGFDSQLTSGQVTIQRNGLILPAGDLADWRQLQGISNPTGDRFVIPQLEPGEYVLCDVLGELPCASGILHEGSELVLRLSDGGSTENQDQEVEP